MLPRLRVWCGDLGTTVPVVLRVQTRNHVYLLVDDRLNAAQVDACIERVVLPHRQGEARAQVRRLLNCP